MTPLHTHAWQARKFPPSLFPGGAVVPVVQCVLRGFDVVYAPLLSSYGSATATLGAWLDFACLKRGACVLRGFDVV